MSDERIYTYECRICQNKYSYPQPGEPMCTGPGLDDHEPFIMVRVHVKDRDRDEFVDPQKQQELLDGPLLLPYYLVTHGAKVKGKLWTPQSDDPNWKEEYEELPTVQQARETFTDDE